MTDNPLDRIPNHDRVSLRAVVLRDGEDPGPALAAAGITDSIALPIMFGEGQPGASFGDGFTPNLTAVLEPDQGQDSDGVPIGDEGFGGSGYDPAAGSDSLEAGAMSGAAGEAVPLPGATTTTLPAAYGLQPLAPVRKSGQV